MEILVTLGALLAAISIAPYIKGVLKGVVKPKIASWLVWCVLSVLLTGAAIASGQFMSAIMSGVTVVATAMVLVLGLKKGSGGFDKLDIICLIGAAAGIAIWLILDNPTLAIFEAVAVDIIAFIPTLVHGWVSPAEESLASYGLASLGASMGLMAAVLAGASAAGLAYPVYSTTFNGLMVVLLTRDIWWPYLAMFVPGVQRERVLTD